MQFFKQIVCSEFVLGLAALTFLGFVAGCFASVATVLLLTQVVR